MKATEKIIKEHHECSCGHNIVEDREVVLTHQYLRSAGYKRRRFKDTGEPFYFLHQHYEHAEGESHYFD